VDNQELYELLVDAVRQALADEAGGGEVRIHHRFSNGAVAFRDAEGKVVKEVPTPMLFKKLTSIREKLRVLEQKLNNHPALSEEDRIEFQAYITRCYGSLTTFNFLFREDQDRFQGSGG
jgi:hypothetical protein